MTIEITPVLRNGWRGQAPDITDDEIRLLLPIVQGGGSWVARTLRAYRAGLATHDARPLSGFDSTCPTCDSVHVAAILWQVVTKPAPRPDESVMWARCFDCATVYRPATGEVWPHDTADLVLAVDPEGNLDRG